MKIYGIIYKVTNLINDKLYIGQTIKTLEHRKTQHENDSLYKSLKSYNYPLHKAIRKYGKENFKWEEIDVAYSKDELNKKEIYYIELYDTFHGDGYNCTIGGEGTIGRTPSQETIEKNRQANSGENNFWYGKKLSDEHKKKISESKKGKKLSDEHKRNISEAQKGRKITFSEEAKENIRRGIEEKRTRRINVYYFDKVTREIGDFIETATNIKRYCREHNLDDGAVHRVLKGKAQHHKGYYFEYAD